MSLVSGLQTEQSYEQLPLPPPGPSNFSIDSDNSAESDNWPPDIVIPLQQLHSGDNVFRFESNNKVSIQHLAVDYTQNNITMHAPLARTGLDNFRALLRLHEGNVTVSINASNSAIEHILLQRAYVVTSPPSIWDQLVVQIELLVSYLWPSLKF